MILRVLFIAYCFRQNQAIPSKITVMTGVTYPAIVSYSLRVMTAFLKP